MTTFYINSQNVTPTSTVSNPISNDGPSSGSWVYYLYQYDISWNSYNNDANLKYSQDVYISIPDQDNYSGIYLAVGACGGTIGSNGNQTTFNMTTGNTTTVNILQGGVGGCGGGGQVFSSSNLISTNSNKNRLAIQVSNLFYYNDAIPNSDNSSNYNTPLYTNSSTLLYTTIVLPNSESVDDTHPTDPSYNQTLPMCFFGQPGMNGGNASEDNEVLTKSTTGNGGNGGNGGSWNGTSGSTTTVISYSSGSVLGGGGGGAGFDGLWEADANGSAVFYFYGSGSNGQSYYCASDSYFNSNYPIRYNIPGCVGITFADGTSISFKNTISNLNMWTSGGECTQNYNDGYNTNSNGNSSWILLYMQLAV